MRIEKNRKSPFTKSLYVTCVRTFCVTYFQIVWTESSQSIYNLTAFICKTNSHSYANGMRQAACVRIHAYQNPEHTTYISEYLSDESFRWSTPPCRSTRIQMTGCSWHVVCLIYEIKREKKRIEAKKFLAFLRSPLFLWLPRDIIEIL